MFSMRAKPPQDDGDIRAFLGEGTSFSGNLQFEGAVRVDGQFEGNVSGSDLLIVGETAAVLANIQIGSLVAGGRVEGNITARIAGRASTDGPSIRNHQNIKPGRARRSDSQRQL